MVVERCSFLSSGTAVRSVKEDNKKLVKAEIEVLVDAAEFTSSTHEVVDSFDQLVVIILDRAFPANVTSSALHKCEMWVAWVNQVERMHTINSGNRNWE